MSHRTVFAALALALALVVVSAAPAKRPPPPGGGGGSSAPTNLRITASSDTSISLAWDVAKSGSNSWWYCVVRNGEGCLRVDPPQTTLSLSRLWPGRTTTYTVVTVDVNGHRSAPSNGVTHTTPPDTTPPSPAPVLTAQAVYPTRIIVSWTQSVDALSQTSHTLFVDGAPVFNAVISPWTVFYLEPSSNHTFKVTASDYFGNTVESDVLSVTTPPKTDNVAPTAPTNLQFSS
jgi:chitinase